MTPPDSLPTIAAQYHLVFTQAESVEEGVARLVFRDTRYPRYGGWCLWGKPGEEALAAACRAVRNIIDHKLVFDHNVRYELRDLPWWKKRLVSYLTKVPL